MHNRNFGILSEMYRILLSFFWPDDDLNDKCRQNRRKDHAKQAPKPISGVKCQECYERIESQLLSHQPGLQYGPNQHDDSVDR